MRRFILSLIVGLLILCPFTANAAGTITTGKSKISVLGSVQRVVVTLTCTADASDGSFPTYQIDPASLGITGWYLYAIETDPGSTAPTANYDIAITNASGLDVTKSAATDRSATATEVAYLGSVGYPMIDGSWTLAITNNSVNSAGIVVKLVFVAN